MRTLGAVSTALLALSLGVAAPVYAQEQHDQQQEEKKAQPEKNAKPAEKKAQPEKPAKQEQKSAQQPERNAKPEERNTQQQDKNNKPEERNAQQQDKNARPAERNAQQQDKNNKPEERNAQQQDRNAKPEERNAQQQSAQPERQAQRGGGGRMPDDRYKANFGREHAFRVSEGDSRNHRFQYGGYWFGFSDPWPSNWLYTQDVFVVEIDGVYYLCNAAYPGVNVALDITL
jgi:cell division protein FtsN